MNGRLYSEVFLDDSGGRVEWEDETGTVSRVIRDIGFSVISLATPVVSSIMLLTHTLHISGEIIRWWMETYPPTNEDMPDSVVRGLACSFHRPTERMYFVCGNTPTLGSLERAMLAIRTMLDRRVTHPFSGCVERLMKHLYIAVAESGNHLLWEMLFHDKQHIPDAGVVRVLYQHFANPWMKEKKHLKSHRYHQCLPGHVVFATPKFETSNFEERNAVAGLAYLERLTAAARHFQKFFAVPTEVLARRVWSS